MNTRVGKINWTLTGCKIFFGSLGALFSAVLGWRICGNFQVFDDCYYEMGYVLPFGLVEIGVTLVAFLLLLSAFYDVYKNHTQVTLLEGDAGE